MMKRNREIFSKSITLISIIVSILGLVGIIITPKNADFIFMGIGIIIVVIVVMDKFNQINENTEDITKLNEKLDIGGRIEKIEKELYEQKGKLSMVIKK